MTKKIARKLYTDNSLKVKILLIMNRLKQIICQNIKFLIKAQSKTIQKWKIRRKCDDLGFIV